MLDELKEEEIIKKAGGRFRLTALIQKRMVALNKGSRPLIDMDTDFQMALVIQEILQDKIYLDSSANLKITGEVGEGEGPDALDFSKLQD